MELGFNFQTRKVETMSEYKVFNVFFDYEKDFLDQPLNVGADKLEEFFTNLAATFQESSNYHIIMEINNSEFLDFEEYFTIFSTFSFVLAAIRKGIDNKQGYLKVKDELKNSLTCTDYTLLKFMNNDYPYGLIQLTIEDRKDTVVKWAHYNLEPKQD